MFGLGQAIHAHTSINTKKLINLRRYGYIRVSYQFSGTRLLTSSTHKLKKVVGSME